MSTKCQNISCNLKKCVAISIRESTYVGIPKVDVKGANPDFFVLLIFKLSVARGMHGTKMHDQS